MNRFTCISDEFYVNLSLNTEMDLPSGRETVLHFFEQMQRKFPTMRNFYSRDRHEYVLEEEKEDGHYRWTTVEPRRVVSVYVNPPTVDDALAQHRHVLDLAPYCLSVSPLDCESLNLTYGFDYSYRGNHNQLIAEALGLPPAFEKLAETPGATLVSYEPTMQFTWDEDCRIQARLGVETRTSPHQIRTGEFPDEQFSIYLTTRCYGSLSSGESLVSTMDRLTAFANELLESYVVEHILEPVRQTIAIK